MLVDPSRSAIVRATLSIRSYARADSPSLTIAILRMACPASSGWACIAEMRGVICALQWMPGYSA